LGKAKQKKDMTIRNAFYIVVDNTCWIHDMIFYTFALHVPTINR